MKRGGKYSIRGENTPVNISVRNGLGTNKYNKKKRTSV